MNAEQWSLLAIVALAFTVEAAIGFGATIIAVALGSFVAPLDRILPALVPLNVALSLAIVVRNSRSVELRMLARRVLPAMSVGMPVGVLVFERAPRSTLQLAFAVFVFVLASLELWRMRRAPSAERPLTPWRSRALLVLAGIVHGAFATGGPPVVYVFGRELPDKGTFRATMSALWLVLNSFLLVVYAAGGRLTGASARVSLAVAPALAVGLIGGEVVHGRLPERLFRAVVFVMLMGVAVILAARA